MSDLGTMTRRIREDLDRGSNFDPRIKQAIADAIAYYKSKRLGFNLKRATAVLTPGNEFVSLPTDWVEADFLRLERDDNRFAIKEVTYDWIEERGGTGPRGQPYKYAIQHRELRLFPIPDRSYTLMLSFQYELKNVSVSASDAATNAWMVEGEQLVRKHAMSDVLINFVDGPEAIAKGELLRAEAEERILPILEAQAAREQSSGQIRPFI